MNLPPEIYLQGTGVQQMAKESNEQWILEKVEIQDGGIFVYIGGAMFPYKNFCTAEAVFTANQVKSLFIETIKLVKWYWGFIIPFLYFDKQKILDAFNRIAWRIMSPHLLKYQYMSSFARALHYVILIFLMEIGLKEDSADKFALLFVHIIDYDNAYRLRIEDLLSETTKEKLANNPRQEIKKLIKLMAERDINQGVSSKINKIARLINLILLVPKIKKAFKKAIGTSEFDKLNYDDADLYWTAIRDDYFFRGLTKEERLADSKGRGWTYPIPTATCLTKDTLVV